MRRRKVDVEVEIEVGDDKDKTNLQSFFMKCSRIKECFRFRDGKMFRLYTFEMR